MVNLDVRKFWSSVFETLWNWYLLFPLLLVLPVSLQRREFRWRCRPPMPSGITDSGKYFNWVIWMNNKLQDHNFLSQNQIEKWRCKSIVSLNLKVWMQSKNYSHCLSFAILPWFLAQFKSLRKNKIIQNISKISNPICFIRLVLISKETLKNRNTKKWFWNYMPFNSCYHTIFMLQTFFENESEK